MIRAGICTDFTGREHREAVFIVCEGYMDVISLHQAGFTNAVSVTLEHALTAGHAALIKRYVNEVYLTYDSDEAGTKAALRAASDSSGGRCDDPRDPDGTV